MLSDEEKKKYEEIKYNNGYLYCDKEDVDCLIDIIEKQSKEIEELSDKLTEKICKGVEEEILEEYRQTIISKDKEIEELKEDNKHQWEERCKLTFELENSTPNDKIKAKIEEYEEQEKDEPDAFLCKRVLQSLLEKE